MDKTKSSVEKSGAKEKPVLIKICCISSLDEAHAALRAGADHLGLVGPMPSGPGVLSLAEIREIVAELPYTVDTWLLTSQIQHEDILRDHQQTGTSTIQLVDHVSPDELTALRALLPLVRLVQVIHVQDETALAQAQSIEPYVDAILLDSGNPSLKVKELGGTGRVHNWSISRRVVEACTKPVYLAGGIQPANIRSAHHEVRPYGIDLCSGVRRDGRLDLDRLSDLFEAITR